MKFRVLYVSGVFDYWGSPSGNYILYKTLKMIPNLEIKVVGVGSHAFSVFRPEPEDLHTEFSIRTNVADFVSRIPAHDFLIMTGPDLNNEILLSIIQKHNSKLIVSAMTHWVFGNSESYPELSPQNFVGPNIQNRKDFFSLIDASILCHSTYSQNVHNISPLKTLRSYVIPLPFDEIDIEHSENTSVKIAKKKILWGTTQPETKRKGLDFFQKVLQLLETKVDNDLIIVQTVGHTVDLNTKFEHQKLGYFPNRTSLSKAYQNADVFAQTTFADAGPMMVVESLKNNLPVVSLKTNISLDLVGDGINGYLCDGAEDFVEKIIQTLFDGTVKMDLDKIKKFNSKESVVQKYEEMFLDLYQKS